MNDFYTFLLVVAAMAAIAIFGEYIIDAWYDGVDRRNYRRASHPLNIEKNAQDLLELELQQFLLEEEIKEKAKSRMEHPSTYSKTMGGGLDKETREILAKLTNPQRQGNQHWWGND